MSRTPTALVSPALLVWGRRSIGLTTDVAATKAGVATEKLQSWESGDSAPTIAQLRTLAKHYKRPLAVFFLDSPPADWDVMRDFRRVPDPDAGQWSPELHGEYRRALDQRDAALDVADRTHEDLPTDWRLSEPLPHADEELAAIARQRLLETAPLPPPGAASDEYAQLGFWVAALEEAGVLVMTSTHFRQGPHPRVAWHGGRCHLRFPSIEISVDHTEGRCRPGKELTVAIEDLTLR